MTTYMLDTGICSLIMREHPESIIHRLASEVDQGNRIVISSLTYSDMRICQIGAKNPGKHKMLVDEFVKRLHSVIPWDPKAVDSIVNLSGVLRISGTSFTTSQTAIMAHAIATGCTLVSSKSEGPERIPWLTFEKWL